jgi:hypothetical protein
MIGLIVNPRNGPIEPAAMASTMGVTTMAVRSQSLRRNLSQNRSRSRSQNGYPIQRRSGSLYGHGAHMLRTAASPSPTMEASCRQQFQSLRQVAPHLCISPIPPFHLPATVFPRDMTRAARYPFPRSGEPPALPATPTKSAKQMCHIIRPSLPLHLCTDPTFLTPPKGQQRHLPEE